jgi:hypothetical protein
MLALGLLLLTKRQQKSFADRARGGEAGAGI